MAAVVMPLPTELTTPPLTNMYLVPIYPLLGDLLSPTVMIQDGQPSVSSEHQGGKGENEKIH
jgi:hypothetical protein